MGLLLMAMRLPPATRTLILTRRPLALMTPPLMRTHQGCSETTPYPEDRKGA